MINAISQSLLFILELLRRFLSYFVGSTQLGIFLRYGIGLGIAVSVFFVAFKLIKGAIWGK